MKLKYTIFLTILVIVYSCNSHNHRGLKQFILEGTIDKIDKGFVVLEYYPGDTLVCDTVKITNGSFCFKGKLAEPGPATLLWNNNHNNLIHLDPGKMKISLSEKDYPEFIMTGSKTQSDFDALEKSTSPFHDKISSLVKQYRSIKDSINASTDEDLKALLRKRLLQTESCRSLLKKKIDSVQVQFVSGNPASYCSVIMLNELEHNEIISPDSVMLLFNGLDNSLKNSTYGNEISDDIRKKLNVKPGAQAPDFKVLDINQIPVTLSQFRGKNVVLLDFWASWCVPCRQSIPHMKEVYNRYHSKGLEIVAVTLDMDKQAWIEAIHKDSTEMWYHIPVAEKYALGEKYITNEDIYKNYSWGVIPAQILISKEGKVINRWAGRSDAVEASIDTTLAELFLNQ